MIKSIESILKKGNTFVERIGKMSKSEKAVTVTTFLGVAVVFSLIIIAKD